MRCVFTEASSWGLDLTNNFTILCISEVWPQSIRQLRLVRAADLEDLGFDGK